MPEAQPHVARFLHTGPCDGVVAKALTAASAARHRAPLEAAAAAGDHCTPADVQDMLIRFIHLLFSDKVNIRETAVFTLWVVKLFIGERFGIYPDAQDRPKRIERVEAPVETERELVQVGL